jgi:predicted lactoylglutathione lyase
MELGAFSVSLTAKDIETSKLFYEKLGLQFSPEINRRIG